MNDIVEDRAKMGEIRICPLMDNEVISESDCLENSTIAEGFLKTDFLPEKARKKENFREICLSCKHHLE